MPIACDCHGLPDRISDVNFQAFIWLAAEADDVVDTEREWVVRCSACGQHWRDGVGFRGIEKVPAQTLGADE